MVLVCSCSFGHTVIWFRLFLYDIVCVARSLFLCICMCHYVIKYITSMLIILFVVGIVFHLADNGYDRLKVENPIVLGVYHMTAFSHV